MSGHSPMKVVAAIILRGDGKFLIARKKTGKPLAGYWEFPGGKMEPDELPEEAIRREIHEELNLTLRDIREYCHYRFQASHRVLEFTFFIAGCEETPMQLTDHDQIVWITPAELKTYHFAPADVTAVSLILEKGL
ncbi:MAG: (deoxy)nucleoside triphosphate pyrophosphohydrolase [Bacteroidia bacterium]